jgi:hypothetical protein
VRQGAKGLDAQGSASAKGAIAQFPNRKPPAVSREASLGARSDLYTFGHFQMPPLTSETEVNAEFFAMVGGRVGYDYDAGERTMKPISACYGLGFICRNG